MRHARGFSLIEVLVAFVILAMTLGVLMNIFSGGLRNLGQGRDYTRALLQAQSRLAAMGVEQPLRPGTQQGDIDDDTRWRATVTPVSAAAMGMALYQIHLQVLWGPADHERAVTLDTLRVAPAP